MHLRHQELVRRDRVPDLDAGGLRDSKGDLRIAADRRTSISLLIARRSAPTAYEPAELGDQQSRGVERGRCAPLAARSEATANGF